MAAVQAVSVEAMGVHGGYQDKSRTQGQQVSRAQSKQLQDGSSYLWEFKQNPVAVGVPQK